MHLSKRMKAVVDLVPRCKCIADIGCDHGYMSIALVEEEKADRAIACDLRPGPLEIARAHVKEHGLETKIDLRLADGLQALSPGEADAVIIAGMGGPLMRSILEASVEVWKERAVLILQPQSEPETVRGYLEEQHYHIRKEVFLLDEGKYYDAMLAEPSGEAGKQSKAELIYGAYNLVHPTADFCAYIEKEAETFTKQLCMLREAEPTERILGRIREVEEALALNRGLQLRREDSSVN